MRFISETRPERRLYRAIINLAAASLTLPARQSSRFARAKAGHFRPIFALFTRVKQFDQTLPRP
jgi:hypothetical protein